MTDTTHFGRQCHAKSSPEMASSLEFSYLSNSRPYPSSQDAKLGDPQHSGSGPLSPQRFVGDRLLYGGGLGT